MDGSHARSHSAPRTSSLPSRDTRALSPLRPQFEASNTVVPMYSQIHADIDSGASMTITPHASLISEGQQCNMSIKLADGSIQTSNIKKGFLDATCNGKLAGIRRQHGHGALEALRLVHATCMRLLSHLHATCGQDHDCNYCNRHEHLNHAV